MISSIARKPTPLDSSAGNEIIDVAMDELEKQLGEKDMTLVVTEAARDQIANEGYDPSYGARPLKRVIQQRLQNQLATEILKGNIESGSGVKIDFRDGDFRFQREEPNSESVGEPVNGT